MTDVLVHKSQSWRYAEPGMTLIELLVALVIFAILGVMGYRAAAVAMESRQRIAAEMQRWRDIANFLQIVESDLTQFVERPDAASAANPVATSSLVVKPSDGGIEFSFLKLDGGGRSVRRRGYRLDGQRVVQLRWPGTDAVSLPDPLVVLENVAAMRCAVIGPDGQRHSAWPGSQAGRAIKPAAIDLELDLAGVGTIRRLVAMR